MTNPIKTPWRRRAWHSSTIEDCEGFAVIDTMGASGGVDALVRIVNTHAATIAAFRGLIIAADLAGWDAGYPSHRDALNAARDALAAATVPSRD